MLPETTTSIASRFRKAMLRKADAKKLEEPTIRAARSKSGQEQDIRKYFKTARTGRQQDCSVEGDSKENP